MSFTLKDTVPTIMNPRVISPKHPSRSSYCLLSPREDFDNTQPSRRIFFDNLKKVKELAKRILLKNYNTYGPTVFLVPARIDFFLYQLFTTFCDKDSLTLSETQFEHMLILSGVIPKLRTDPVITNVEENAKPQERTRSKQQTKILECIFRHRDNIHGIPINYDGFLRVLLRTSRLLYRCPRLRDEEALNALILTFSRSEALYQRIISPTLKLVSKDETIQTVPVVETPKTTPKKEQQEVKTHSIKSKDSQLASNGTMELPKLAPKAELSSLSPEKISEKTIYKSIVQKKAINVKSLEPDRQVITKEPEKSSSKDTSKLLSTSFSFPSKTSPKEEDTSSSPSLPPLSTQMVPISPKPLTHIKPLLKKITVEKNSDNTLSGIEIKKPTKVEGIKSLIKPIQSKIEKTVQESLTSLPQKTVMFPQPENQNTSIQTKKKLTFPEFPIEKEIDSILKPQKINNLFKPKEINNLLKPKEINNIIKPKEINSIFKPKKINNLFKPKEINNLFKPKEINNIIKPKEINNIIKPKEINNLFKPKEINTIIKPQESKITTTESLPTNSLIDRPQQLDGSSADEWEMGRNGLEKKMYELFRFYADNKKGHVPMMTQDGFIALVRDCGLDDHFYLNDLLNLYVEVCLELDVDVEEGISFLDFTNILEEISLDYYDEDSNSEQQKEKVYISLIRKFLLPLLYHLQKCYIDTDFPCLKTNDSFSAIDLDSLDTNTQSFGHHETPLMENKKPKRTGDVGIQKSDAVLKKYAEASSLYDPEMTGCRCSSSRKDPLHSKICYLVKKNHSFGHHRSKTSQSNLLGSADKVFFLHGKKNNIGHGHYNNGKTKHNDKIKVYPVATPSYGTSQVSSEKNWLFVPTKKKTNVLVNPPRRQFISPPPYVATHELLYASSDEDKAFPEEPCRSMKNINSYGEKSLDSKSRLHHRQPKTSFGSDYSFIPSPYSVTCYGEIMNERTREIVPGYTSGPNGQILGPDGRAVCNARINPMGCVEILSYCPPLCPPPSHERFFAGWESDESDILDFLEKGNDETSCSSKMFYNESLSHRSLNQSLCSSSSMTLDESETNSGEENMGFLDDYYPMHQQYGTSTELYREKLHQERPHTVPHQVEGLSKKTPYDAALVKSPMYHRKPATLESSNASLSSPGTPHFP